MFCHCNKFYYFYLLYWSYTILPLVIVLSPVRVSHTTLLLTLSSLTVLPLLLPLPLLASLLVLPLLRTSFANYTPFTNITTLTSVTMQYYNLGLVKLGLKFSILLFPSFSPIILLIGTYYSQLHL